MHDLRLDNYGCGDVGEPVKKPDEGVWYGFFCALLVTYALELLFIPAIATNNIIRALKTKGFARRRLERMAERIEHYVGMALKLLQCAQCIRADFRNMGELEDFALHFVSLFPPHCFQISCV